MNNINDVVEVLEIGGNSVNDYLRTGEYILLGVCTQEVGFKASRDASTVTEFVYSVGKLKK